MGKAKGGYTAIVLDTNVVISALIREQGFNRYIVSLAPRIYPSFYPEVLRSEVLRHAREIALKSGMEEYEILLALQAILEPVELLPDKSIVEQLAEAQRLVKDPDDAIYVATALYLRYRKEYQQAILVTWNKRDYDFWQLMKRWVRILDPKEFYNNYLRPFSSQNLAQCLLCNTSSLNKAVEASLLYIGERQYIVVESETPNRVVIETPCHRVLIKWNEERRGYCILPQCLAINECIKKMQQLTDKRLQEIEHACEICKSQ